MRRSQSGFTLIELLIVISIIGLLAAVLLPRVLEARGTAQVFADERNLARHFSWLEQYKVKLKHLPNEGGHKFVLATWTSGVVEHTEENFDCYFNPSIRENDPEWTESRKLVQKGENPWPDLRSTASKDTHYAGRAKEHMQTRTQSADEAWMADDNEGLWSHSDGTVNILFNGGNVRSYSYQQMEELFGLPKFDLNQPIQTWGPNSPIPACRKLEL